jgi:UDP-perosamine 4-acetyltransferase
LGEGVQIMAGTVVQPGSKIGDNTILNTRSSVDHDCEIGAHVHIAPGVTLSGGVRVHDDAHIGAGAVLIQGVEVGASSLVAAGSVVIHAVPANTRVAGMPARKLNDE